MKTIGFGFNRNVYVCHTCLGVNNCDIDLRNVCPVTIFLRYALKFVTSADRIADEIRSFRVNLPSMTSFKPRPANMSHSI
jgi:hypothetical protein